MALGMMVMTLPFKCLNVSSGLTLPPLPLLRSSQTERSGVMLVKYVLVINSFQTCWDFYPVCNIDQLPEIM